MHASNEILFNHESPIRGEPLSPARSRAPSPRSIAGYSRSYFSGNLDAMRDWGHARDFVEGMWLILQQEQPDDYVLATGEAHSVREFVDKAFAYSAGPSSGTEAASRRGPR